MSGTSIAIVELTDDHLDTVVALSLEAWAPVFQSMATHMEDGVFNAFYPRGWKEAQAAGVRQVCTMDSVESWVAVSGKDIAGFVAIKFPDDGVMGEIWMVAVSPDHQGKGIGKALTDHALSRMRDEGLQIAMVETGGDPGHAPARRTYEAAGFKLWNVARYFQEL